MDERGEQRRRGLHSTPKRSKWQHERVQDDSRSSSLVEALERLRREPRLHAHFLLRVHRAPSPVDCLSVGLGGSEVGGAAECFICLSRKMRNTSQRQVWSMTTVFHIFTARTNQRADWALASLRTFMPKTSQLPAARSEDVGF